MGVAAGEWILPHFHPLLISVLQEPFWQLTVYIRVWKVVIYKAFWLWKGHPMRLELANVRCTRSEEKVMNRPLGLLCLLRFFGKWLSTFFFCEWWSSFHRFFLTPKKQAYSQLLCRWKIFLLSRYDSPLPTWGIFCIICSSMINQNMIIF